MIKRCNENNDIVECPHTLLLSLVDVGSLDIEDALLACVKEMSNAEVKRVLNSLQLPECADCDNMTDSDDDLSVEVPDLDDMPADAEDDNDVEDDIEAEDGIDDDSKDAELESRITRLERVLNKMECGSNSCNEKDVDCEASEAYNKSLLMKVGKLERLYRRLHNR
jgi:hypothetical protein